MYSVRHGYKLLTASSLHLDPQLHFIEWKNLLSLLVPPKVKNFLWRCMHHVLPVREILKKRHVWAGGGCLFYPEELETMEHIFCDCAVVNQKDIASFPSTVRRQVEVVSSLWSDTYSKTSTSTVIDTNSGSWILLPINKLKCNVDAAIFDDWAGFGAVVQNHEGKFVPAYGARLECGRDPFLAESMAVKEALAWLKARGFNNLLLESNCLSFCYSFNATSLDLSCVGLIVMQCRSISSDIGNVSVHYVMRSHLIDY
nr:uncharacterized protein LOC109152486 [Ipomoea trifida]